MNYSYLDLINLFWQKDIEHSFQPNEAALYFFILKTANALRWKNPVGLSNAKVMAQFGIGKKAFDTAKRNLKNAGLIDFRAGDGRGNVYQYTLCVESEVLCFDGSGIGKVRQKVGSKDTLSDTLSGNLSGTLSARKGATSIDIEVDIDNTHTHSKKSAWDFPENSDPAGQNPESPQSPGCARPPFPGYPVADDVPPPPATTLESIAGRQFQAGKGLVTPEQVLETWKSWLPLNVTGEKFYNNVNDIYRHFSNRCEQIRISNPEPPKPRAGGFQNGSTAGPARGRGATIEDLQKLKRRSAAHDSQRDDFAEAEIVE